VNRILLLTLAVLINGNLGFAAIISIHPTKPVAYWPANGNTRDTAGGNNGTIVGNVRYQSDSLSKAFSLDGNHSFVAVPDAPAFHFQNQLTIELWIKPSAGNLLNDYQGLVASDFFGIEISNGYGGVMGANFYISSDAGASWGQTASANGGGAPVSAGHWHHVAGVYDGATVRLYLDGQPWGNPAAAYGNISPMLDGSYLCLGGEDGRTFCGCTDRYFNGLIDEVKIYNRPLAASEIKAEFNRFPLRR
jgi:Concanavalin A-like lectin/glucanases superfamily